MATTLDQIETTVKQRVLKATTGKPWKCLLKCKQTYLPSGELVLSCTVRVVVPDKGQFDFQHFLRACDTNKIRIILLAIRQGVVLCEVKSHFDRLVTHPMGWAIDAHGAIHDMLRLYLKDILISVNRSNGVTSYFVRDNSNNTPVHGKHKVLRYLAQKGWIDPLVLECYLLTGRSPTFGSVRTHTD